MKEKTQEKKFKILKTFDTSLQEYLIGIGIPYTKEKVNDLVIYAFFIDENIEKEIYSKFSSNNFFFEKLLRF